MSVLKCKMCGGTLNINSDETIAVCEYCNTTQTLPKINSDLKLKLYDRANHLRRNNEFDKASEIYEQILNEDTTDAESYWSLVLCRYGIEYVEDPQTHRRKPTVNRCQFTSIFADENYKAAIQYADIYQKSIYELEASTIDYIQKNILTISKQEEPFDVFICYKETDSNGRRTLDSALATELYQELTRNGFKVFFSRITLEDKLGEEYEPYIFSAIHSAKVMIVLGTKPEHFSSAWVKNEWSRYLALIKAGENKILIPAYKNMNPYDLPEDFSHLQAQDMSKLGFMQDLSHNINKIVRASSNQQNQTAIKHHTDIDSVALIKRSFLYLEDEEWEKAENNAEKILNSNPENAYSYLIKLLVELKISDINKLCETDVLIDDIPAYQKAVRFADKELKEFLINSARYIRDNNQASIYEDANNLLHSKNIEDIKFAKNMFKSISNYKDSNNLISKCDDYILTLGRKKKLLVWGTIITVFVVIISCIGQSIYFNYYVPYKEYESAVEYLNNGDYYNAYLYFKDIDYKDSQELLREAQYGHVTTYYSRENQITYRFLQELKQINYRDSNKLFDDLYKWDVNISYCNTDSDDESTFLGYAPSNCSYYHIGFSFKGGEPDETITAYTKTLWPNGEVYTSSWFWEDISNGSNPGILWEDGFSSITGTLTIEIYNADTDELIDRVSLQIEK